MKMIIDTDNAPKAILEIACFTIDEVVIVIVLLDNIADIAKAAYEVAKLTLGAKVKIEMIA